MLGEKILCTISELCLLVCLLGFECWAFYPIGVVLICSKKPVFSHVCLCYWGSMNKKEVYVIWWKQVHLCLVTKYLVCAKNTVFCVRWDYMILRQFCDFWMLLLEHGAVNILQILKFGSWPGIVGARLWWWWTSKIWHGVGNLFRAGWQCESGEIHVGRIQIPECQRHFEILNKRIWTGFSWVVSHLWFFFLGNGKW